MKLALPKTFWMMKLLNRQNSRPIRSILAASGFLLTLLCTFNGTLARETARRFWVHGDSKLAVRRVAWYCRRGWTNLDVSKDDFFDPTEGMKDTELDALNSFVHVRKRKQPAVIHASDLAIIAARRLNNNTDPASRHKNVSAFVTACNQMLTTPVEEGLSLETPDEPRTGDFPIDDAKVTLQDFATLFPNDDMQWFVISGTFLGLIRENGFLAHDYDIDLGVFEQEIDIQDAVAKISTSDRFVLKKYDHHTSTLFDPPTPSINPDVPYILKLVHVTGIHIDLFVHYRDTATTPPTDWHGSSIHRWENSAFDLATYTFYNFTVLGPANSDRYLTENYGDWRTPVTEFNCTTDTPNLVLVPHPIAIVIFLKRYVLARQANPSQAKKLEMELLHNGFLKPTSKGDLIFSGDLFSG